MRIAAALLAAISFLWTTGPVWGSTLSVTPIRLVLTPEAPLGTFTVINDGPIPSRAQLVMNAWSQVDGKDVLTPSREVLVNPTIFEVPANGRQLVRLGLHDKPAGGTEQSYRLVLREVPSAAQLRGGTVGVLLQVSVPLFVPVDGAAAKLDWHAAVNGKELLLDIANKGNRHAQILHLKIVGPSGTLVDSGGSTYVLPGGRGRIALKLANPPKPGDTLRIEARTDNGDVQATVSTDRS